MPQHLVLITAILGVGGVERHHLRMLDELGARGWETTVVATVPAEHGWYEEYARRSSEIVLIYEEQPASAVKRVGELMHEKSPELVVISNSEFGYVLLPYLRNVAPATAIIDLLHNFPPDSDGGYAKMSVEHADQIDLTIAVGGGFLERWMRDRGRVGDNIEVCYDGVDVTYWRPDEAVRSKIRNELALGDEPLIVFVGRLSEEKRPLLAASVFDALARNGSDFAAVMVGDGPEREKLERFVERQGLRDIIRLEGAVPAERVRELVVAADVCLQTSAYEGLSGALMEAMACGAVVVGPDVGGQRELVAPGTGVLISRDEHSVELHRYVEAVSALLSDSEQRGAMASRGREHVETTFDVAVTTQRLWMLLERAQHRHATAPPPVPMQEAVARSATEARTYLQLIEHSPISRPVGFRQNIAVGTPERVYRLLRRAGRPIYLWARKRFTRLDRLNEALKRWIVDRSD